MNTSMEYNLNPPVRAFASHELKNEEAKNIDIKPSAEAEAEAERAADAETVFPQSVASGDPTSEGAILWTRINPDIHEPTRRLAVDVAIDDSFEDRQRSFVRAEEISPEHDYTVKVDIDISGIELDPDEQYYYRFVYGGTPSQTGKFRTLPAEDAKPEHVRFAVITCQDYLYGNFGVHRHIAEEDIDFILDLGDFIYEYSKRRPGSRDYPGREIEFPDGSKKATTLNDYRYLYQKYHSDPSLQTALEEHARIFTWDDHEFANDIYWDDNGTPRAPDHPASEGDDRIPGVFKAALKAWWEYTPTRAEYDEDASRLNERIEIQRSFQFGDLLTLVVTDERLHKTEPDTNCAETRMPEWLKHRIPNWLPFCYVNKDPEQTMLGEDQREWFVDEVVKSSGLWTAWANEVLTLPARVGIGPFALDPSDEAWDGYESEREEIMHRIKYADVENFLTLTGDMHSYLVGYQRLEYPSVVRHWLTNPDPVTEQSRRVGVELMTPAMTSINFAEKLGEDFASRVPNSYRKQFPRTFERVRRVVGNTLERLFVTATLHLMPHVEKFNSHDWGYSVVELTREHCLHHAYAVDKIADPMDSEKRLMNTVRIPEGSVEIHHVPKI